VGTIHGGLTMAINGIKITSGDSDKGTLIITLYDSGHDEENHAPYDVEHIIVIPSPTPVINIQRSGDDSGDFEIIIQQ